MILNGKTALITGSTSGIGAACATALAAEGASVMINGFGDAAAIEAQRAILERISALTVDLVLPGHGPMFSDVAGALRRACSRLDHFARDPAGHARYAVKALVKFRLLERERIREQEAIDEVAQVPLLARANARHLRMSAPELGRWAIEALIQAGAARRDGDTIVNP